VTGEAEAGSAGAQPVEEYPVGGSAPATGCSVLSDVGKQTLVPYTADYYFYHGNK
jgi:hypothetical protein